jgi:hypothetical protein
MSYLVHTILHDLEGAIKPSEVGDSLEFGQLLDHSSSSILKDCGYNGMTSAEPLSDVLVRPAGSTETP